MPEPEPVLVEPTPVAIDGTRLDIAGQVRFRTNEATLLPESQSVLDEVSALLNAHPELTLVRIEGHTDTRGSAAYNLDLSSRRAASVRARLIEGGIAAERLVAEGFGEGRPLVTELTDADRARNRRVEFHVVERSDGAGEAELIEKSDTLRPTDGGEH